MITNNQLTDFHFKCDENNIYSIKQAANHLELDFEEVKKNLDDKHISAYRNKFAYKIAMAVINNKMDKEDGNRLLNDNGYKPIDWEHLRQLLRCKKKKNNSFNF